MDKIDVNDIVKGTTAQLLHGCASNVFTGISTDSRMVAEGHLFVALYGERFDGHAFIPQALENGAKGLLVSRWQDVEGINPGVAVLLVKDTLKALQDVSEHYRLRFNIPVIGVTGSNGKTTTKDMIAAILSQRFPIQKTQGNYNNEIGVPLTLLGLERYHSAAVVEMGMRGLGQIKRLCEIVHPTIGVITNVGVTHIGELGSQADIAIAKGELIQSLGSKDVAILNGDDRLVRELGASTSAKVLYYGLSSQADIEARNVTMLGNQQCRFDLKINREETTVVLPVPGEHNVYNALAAAGVAAVLGFSLNEIRNGLRDLELTAMRCEFIDFPGFKVINDAYNASPASMEAALKMMSGISAKRKIAVLGDMLELGEQSEKLHYHMGIKAVESGVDYLLTVGHEAKNIAKGACEAGMPSTGIVCCASNEEAGEKISVLAYPGDLILLKASRGMRFEEIISYLRENIM